MRVHLSGWYTVTMEPIPSAVRTVAIDRVPAIPPDPAADATVRTAHDAADAPEEPVEVFSGYLADLDPARRRAGSPATASAHPDVRAGSG